MSFCLRVKEAKKHTYVLTFISFKEGLNPLLQSTPMHVAKNCSCSVGNAHFRPHFCSSSLFFKFLRRYWYIHSSQNPWLPSVLTLLVLCYFFNGFIHYLLRPTVFNNFLNFPQARMIQFTHFHYVRFCSLLNVKEKIF